VDLVAAEEIKRQTEQKILEQSKLKQEQQELDQKIKANGVTMGELNDNETMWVIIAIGVFVIICVVGGFIWRNHKKNNQTLVGGGRKFSEGEFGTRTF
jgi:cytochrome b subunit of formate dehydrogenase